MCLPASVSVSARARPFLPVRDVEHVGGGAAGVRLGHGGGRVAVLHREGDPAAGLAVDEPGDGAAEAAQGDGAVGIGRDQLVGAIVGGGELVGPGGEGADPFHGGVGGQPGPGHAGALRVPVEGAGEQLLAAFGFLDDGGGARDGLRHDPRIRSLLAFADRVAVLVQDPLKCRPRPSNRAVPSSRSTRVQRPRRRARTSSGRMPDR
jgi:hypothetical protein